MAESSLLDDVDVEAPLLWDRDDNVGAAAAGRKCAVAPGVGRHGDGSKPISINFNGMNIHLPAVLWFTRYQGYDS